MEKEGQSPLSHPPVLQAADAVGEILLSLSYLPTAERLTVVVVKAKNLIWTNDKTTAGKAPLAAWLLLHVAGGSCALAAKPWAPEGISRCRAQRQAPHPQPRLSSGALDSGKINPAGETREPWSGGREPLGVGCDSESRKLGHRYESSGQSQRLDCIPDPKREQGHRDGAGISGPDVAGLREPHSAPGN